MHPVIDSHVHFWQPANLSYIWLQDLPTLNRAYLPIHLTEAAPPHLQGMVFVQADCVPADGQREVSWVSELAQEEARIQAIVAFAPLEEGTASTSYLEKLKTFPLVKGVRRLLQSEAPGFALQPEFVRGVQQLAHFGYSFDICIRHSQMPDAIRLVEQCPNVAFVLDHFGKPAIKDQVLEPWATQLRQLAEFPNVCCKLSGLVTEADHQQWTEADLRPYLEVALAAFGSKRLMFGGDWPVSELATSYRRWLETAVSMLSALSETEKNNIFFENAQSFYRLGG